jgi:hypothetical protein
MTFFMGLILTYSILNVLEKFHVHATTIYGNKSYYFLVKLKVAIYLEINFCDKEMYVISYIRGTRSTNFPRLHP